MRILACCEDILKEKKSYLARYQCLIFFKSFSGTRALPPVLLGTADYNTDDRPTVQEEVSP